MDTSVASLNRSTFEERQKNVSYLRTLYFLLALQLVLALAWALVVVNVDSVKEWVKWAWILALIIGIIAALILLAVFFVPALNKGGAAGIAIYAVFTLLFAYLWGYCCSVNERNYGFYILLLLTFIAIGFAVYTWYSPINQGIDNLPPVTRFGHDHPCGLAVSFPLFPHFRRYSFLLAAGRPHPGDDLRLLLEL